MSKKQKTNENAGKTSERKPRIFGRIDENTWSEWKRHAKNSGLTFTEWASKSLDRAMKREKNHAN